MGNDMNKIKNGESANELDFSRFETISELFNALEHSGGTIYADTEENNRVNSPEYKRAMRAQDENEQSELEKVLDAVRHSRIRGFICNAELRDSNVILTVTGRNRNILYLALDMPECDNTASFNSNREFKAEFIVNSENIIDILKKIDNNLTV